MAIIGTLRNKMTKWVVGFVAVAVSAFILNDLFGNGPRSLFGGNDNSVGKIDGKDISLEEYQAAMQEQENNYIMRVGRQPGESERASLQQQGWEMLITRNAIMPQVEKALLQVSPEEIWDMIQGKNIDENIKQSFQDSTGQFDRSRLIAYINSLNIPQPTDPNTAAAWAESRYRWEAFKRDLGLSRERAKYENLINKTAYVTTAEAEREYHRQQDVVETDYLFVPFSAIKDSTLTPTEDQLKKYYNAHKQEYQTAALKGLIFVSFPVIPSAEDSAAVRKSVEELVVDFATAADDSLFAASNTEGATPFRKYTVGNLPDALKNQINNLKAGQVYGPFLEGKNYLIQKIVSIGTDPSYSAKASHILFKWENESAEAKKAAKEKAEKVLSEIKKGADFADKARQYGQDGTAAAGGDLGWFSQGQMVGPFEKAVFAATKEGLLPALVETQFGYHIIKVTHVKTNVSYGIASIEIAISPSDETANKIFQKTQNFLTDVNDIDDFKEKAKKENLIVQEAPSLPPDGRFIGGLGEARQIVTWLYRTAKVGKVSSVFEINNQYVVASISSSVDAGPKPFELAKNEIEALVKNELKAEQIIAKLAPLKGSLEDIQKSFGPDASVGHIADLTLAATSLPTIGNDPIAVGKAFSVESGKRTSPVKGENGVIIFDVKNKTVAPASADYTVYKAQLLQSFAQKTSAIDETIKSSVGIEDARYKFY